MFITYTRFHSAANANKFFEDLETTQGVRKYTTIFALSRRIPLGVTIKLRCKMLLLNSSLESQDELASSLNVIS